MKLSAYLCRDEWIFDWYVYILSFAFWDLEKRISMHKNITLTILGGGGRGRTPGPPPGSSYVHPFIHQSINQSICTSDSLPAPVHPSIHQSIHQSSCSSDRLSTNPFIYPCICSSIRPPIQSTLHACMHPFIHPLNRPLYPFHPFARSSIHPPIYTSFICLSVYVSVHQSYMHASIHLVAKPIWNYTLLNRELKTVNCKLANWRCVHKSVAIAVKEC